MSKNNKVADKAVEENPLANPQGKTVEELKEIATTLQDQINHHREKKLYHQMMETKGQGALEVMLQMIPKQEVEEMIAQEAKNNGGVKEGSEG